MPSILLIDNGSSRPEAILGLRGLAAALSLRLGEPVHPVSLLHSDKVPATALQGQPADTLEPWLGRALAAGKRDFLLVPLLFGPSRALSHFIPEMATALGQDFGPFQLRLAPELCPLPVGEPRLTQILLDQIRATAAIRPEPLQRVLLVDHGSPIPQVTAVRTWLAARLREHLGPTVSLDEAVMERRPGADYDFNGNLVELALRRLAAADPRTPVILALLFLSPGRHAGPGGDIANICARVEQEVPGFRVHPTPLVGTHPGLLEILAERTAGAQT